MIRRDSCPNPQQPQPQTQPTAIEIEYVTLFIISYFRIAARVVILKWIKILHSELKYSFATENKAQWSFIKVNKCNAEVCIPVLVKPLNNQRRNMLLSDRYVHSVVVSRKADESLACLWILPFYFKTFYT